MHIYTYNGNPNRVITKCGRWSTKQKHTHTIWATLVDTHMEHFPFVFAHFRELSDKSNTCCCEFLWCEAVHCNKRLALRLLRFAYYEFYAIFFTKYSNSAFPSLKLKPEIWLLPSEKLFIIASFAMFLL